jgi:hypothetical protein
MDAGRAPQRIRRGDSGDQGLDFGGDGRPAHCGPAGELGPVVAEASPLPAQHGVGSDDHEGFLPPGPQPGQPSPEETIARPQLRPLRRPLEHGELVAQGQVLEGEAAVPAAEEGKEAK